MFIGRRALDHGTPTCASNRAAASNVVQALNRQPPTTEDVQRSPCRGSRRQPLGGTPNALIRPPPSRVATNVSTLACRFTKSGPIPAHSRSLVTRHSSPHPRWCGYLQRLFQVGQQVVDVLDDNGVSARLSPSTLPGRSCSLQGRAGRSYVVAQVATGSHGGGYHPVECSHETIEIASYGRLVPPFRQTLQRTDDALRFQPPVVFL